MARMDPRQDLTVNLVTPVQWVERNPQASVTIRYLGRRTSA